MPRLPGRRVALASCPLRPSSVDAATSRASRSRYTRTVLPTSSPLPRRGAAHDTVAFGTNGEVSASKARSSQVERDPARADSLRFQGAEQPLRQSDSVAVHHGRVFGFQGTEQPLRQPSLRACRRIQGTEQPLRSTNQWPRLPGRRAALASRRDRAGRPARYRRDFLTSSNAICWEVRHVAASRAPRSPHTLSAQGTSQAIRVVAASRALHCPCNPRGCASIVEGAPSCSFQGAALPLQPGRVRRS